MKTLTVGDLHLKGSKILPIVSSLAYKYEVDNIVLLGDYVDEWGAKVSQGIEELKFLIKWKNSHEANHNIYFMCGNHDLQYIINEYCSGAIAMGHSVYKPYLEQLNLQTLVEIDNYYFSHAGLTKTWCDALSITDNSRDIMTTVKTLLDNKHLRRRFLNSAGYIRGGDGYPSIMWADLKELLNDPLKGIKQVVGHSPVESIAHVEIDNSEFFFCDTLSIRSDGYPIGDASFLLLDGDDFRIIELKQEFGFPYKDVLNNEDISLLI